MWKMICVLLFGYVLSANAHEGPDDPKNTEDLIEAMQMRYKGHWFDAFTFVQKTIRFNADGSARDTATWYEAIQYPDNFRIDFGPPNLGNSSIFRRDSAYRFREGELKKTTLDPQAFLLIKGGLYHYTTEEVITKLRSYGYEVNRFRRDSLDGHLVYVIGAEKGDLQSPQLWLDAKDFYLRRRISSLSDERVLDVRYSDHIQSGGGWVEQIVQFYLNGRYVQIEYYEEIDTQPKLPPSLFDPQQFATGKHWYQQE